MKTVGDDIHSQSKGFWQRSDWKTICRGYDKRSKRP